MANINRDLFGRSVEEVLQFELDFVEQGGYGRSVRSPRTPKILFRDSPTCLNFDDEFRAHPCSACALIDFVPQDMRDAAVPCHHIPLNERGDSIASMFDPMDDGKSHEALAQWLRATLAKLRAASEQGAGEKDGNGNLWCAET